MGRRWWAVRGHGAWTTVLYLWTTRHGTPPPEEAPFRLGRWERPVVAGALTWLGIELVILLAPAQFRPAQACALGAVAMGLGVTRSCGSPSPPP
jgi:hypothetical protein